MERGEIIPLRSRGYIVKALMVSLEYPRIKPTRRAGSVLKKLSESKSAVSFPSVFLTSSSSRFWMEAGISRDFSYRAGSKLFSSDMLWIAITSCPFLMSP